MEPTQVKLIKSHSDGTEYYMLHQQQIGKGGNAVVYQAMDPTHPSEKMVVKVIRITDEHKRAIIERELSIIEELPPHPNIVKTWPIRCFSERNYYIFMEMCEGGTLSMELNRRLRQGFTENDILNIAYQLVQGYNVLYAHKIIHLDIKPDNILISKGQFKLADFGLAVLENPLQVARKEGTKTYMSPQRLVNHKYVPNALADVYSLGIVLFMIVVGYHPYLSQAALHMPLKDFVEELLSNTYQIPKLLMHYSLEFGQFFQCILSMIERNPLKRISFDKVYKFVSTSKLFNNFHNIQSPQQRQEQTISIDHKFIINEISQIEIQRLNFEHQLKCVESEQALISQKELKAIEEYIISTRIVVCFLNRLARRLQLQNSIREIECTDSHKLLRLALLRLEDILLLALIHEFKTCNQFPIAKWQLFQKSEGKQLISLIERDYSYIKVQIEDHKRETEKVKPGLISKSQTVFSGSLQSCLAYITEALKQHFKQESRVLTEYQRTSLITLLYVARSWEICTNLDKWLKEYSSLEKYDYEIETLKTDELVKRVMIYCEQIGSDIQALFLVQEQSQDTPNPREQSKTGVIEIIDQYE